MLNWCGTSEPAAARLVTGDGGAGKTRLALRLCQKLQLNGWQPLWVSPGQEKEVVGVARELGTPCVAVVDYAETRYRLNELLNDVVANMDGPDLRVVMLARSSGEWWQRLISNSEDQAARLLATPPIKLRPIPADGGQTEIFAEALTAFAEKFQVNPPEATLALNDRDPVVLVVHAAALLAVLNHAEGDIHSHPQSAEEVLTELLAHEARYWAKSAGARVLELDVSVLRLAVMAGSLIGADNEPSTAALMARIPDLTDSASLRGKVARWLHDLYPVSDVEAAGNDEWIGSVQPDRIAEHLATTELAQQTELVSALFAGLSRRRATRALTVLARAAHTQPSVHALIHSALTANFDELAIPAMSVAVQTNQVLEEILSKILQGNKISASTLSRIGYAAVHPTFRLDAPAAIAFKRLAAEDVDDIERAGLLMQLSESLRHLGQLEEALAAIDQAVSICRQQAEGRAPGFPYHLMAGALEAQSRCLAGLERWEEALAAADQAVRICRQLAKGETNFSLFGLASALDLQSRRLARLERWEEALAAADEALIICRKLAEDRTNSSLFSLANALDLRSSCLANLGRSEEALASIERAISIYRQLDNVLLNEDLARALDVQSSCLASLGWEKRAREAAHQAATIRHTLAEVRSSPSRRRPPRIG